MKITHDWHIHSHYSPCGSKRTEVAAIAEGARARGILSFGLTDHLFTGISMGLLREARRAYDELASKEGFHFGVEASCLREYDLRRYEADPANASAYGYCTGGPEEEPVLFLPEELWSGLKVEYVIAGAHWPLGVPDEIDAVMRNYHRQNILIAEHPQVDVIAHPWWWNKALAKAGYGGFAGWVEDFSIIPKSMHDELASAALEHGKAIEINANATLLNGSYPETFRREYLEYLAYLKSRGVTFSIGSDSHGPGYAGRLHAIEGDLDQLGLSEADLWMPADS
jgi:histidinol phosphatase-like PHP family hydrolase